MQQIEVSRTIPAPLAAVFARYTDHAGWSSWAGLGRVRLGREGRPERDGTGCVRVIGGGPLAVHEEVLSFEPPRRMTYRVVKGLLPMRDHFGEVAFEAVPEGTRIVWRCRFESALPGAGPATAWVVRQVFARVLRKLSALTFPAARAPA